MMKCNFDTQVGCRLPWDKWSQEERNVCTSRLQFRLFPFDQFRDRHPVWLSTIHCFREFEQLFTILLDADMSKITRVTGCKKPCSYKEYNFVNTNLKELAYYTFPKDQITFCLWAVSQNTHIEEEVLVYSFESLIAELGGSLGLFLGFSFMTIWDGFKNFVTWMINLYTSQKCGSALAS